MTASVARISYDGSEACTGTVVASGWILTAYHCLFGETNGQADPSKVLDISKMSASIWSSGMGSAGSVEADMQVQKTFSMPNANITHSATGHYDFRDIALLRVTGMPSWAKPVAVASSWPTVGTTLTEYGYGRIGRDAGSSATLQKSKQGDVARIDCPTSATNNTAPNSPFTGSFCTMATSSFLWRGDSGGPVMWWTNGAWEIVGVFNLFSEYLPPTTPKAGWRAFWATADGATRAWIFQTMSDNPAPAPSATVSNNAGQMAVQLTNFPLGTSYFFCHTGSGYPTGGTVPNHGQVNVTSPNQSWSSGWCSGSGNFWVGIQATDGHDYYSNQVTLGTPTPELSAATPVVSGLAKVGKTLVVSTGTWAPGPVVLSASWLRNGVGIGGAIGLQYELTPEDLGSRISVAIWGTKAGYSSKVITSSETAPIGAGTLLTKTPKISGALRVGKTLTAKAGAWRPSGTLFTFQWYRNGKAITGATSDKYKLVKGDKGKRMRVKVTGYASGYTSASITSKSTTKIKRR